MLQLGKAIILYSCALLGSNEVNYLVNVMKQWPDPWHYCNQLIWSLQVLSQVGSGKAAVQIHTQLPHAILHYLAGFQQINQHTPYNTKISGLFSQYLRGRFISWKIFHREMLIITQSTTLLQIFCEFMINYEVIFKSILGPDDTCWGNLLAWMG